MATIQSLGIGSGILTTALVEDLVKAERGGADLRLGLQQSEYEAEISAFGAVTSAVESLRTATSDLAQPGATGSLVANSSDTSALTATTSSIAQAGSYAVVVDSLAQSHSLVTQSYATTNDVVGTGELTFRYGTTTFTGDDYTSFSRDTDKLSKTLTIDSSNNTLSSLRNAINDAELGVQASIVNDGNGFRLLLVAEEGGASNSLEVSVSAAAGDGLNALAFNSASNGNSPGGAVTDSGSTDLSTGIDFATTNATFSLSLGAISNIDVTVTANATGDLGGGGNTAEDNRIAIQAAVDTALIAKDLNAGDIVVSIDPGDNGLVLTSAATGLAQTIEITAADAVLGLNPAQGVRYGTGGMQQTQAAQSAEFTVNGLAITRESNQVVGVINGVTMNLASADPDRTISLNVVTDATALTAKVQGFIDSFNELKVLSDELTKFDVENGEAGLLLGDSTLRGVNTGIRAIMNSLVDGIEGSSFRSLAEVGIATNQNNNFLLELDEARFSAAVSESPDGIRSLFATNTASTDPQVEVFNTGLSTQAGSYAVNIIQLATQGSYTGDTTAGLAGPLTVTNLNSTFVMEVNGVASQTVTLTEGSYADGTALAEEMQLRINNDASLSAAGQAITVNYDAVNMRLELLSSKYGSESNVAFVTPTTNLAADFGLGSLVGTGLVGLDISGTINGERAMGKGQLLRASEARPGLVYGSGLTGGPTVPLVVDAADTLAGNYDLKVNVDGQVSGTLRLAEGSYETAADMAVALQAAINSDTTLAGAGKSVTVEYDAVLERFGVISTSTGVNSQVNFSSLGAGLVADYALALGGGTQGGAASATGLEASGMRLRVTGGAVGERGTVSYTQGTAYRLRALFDGFLSTGGVLKTKVEGLSSLLTEVEESQGRLDERMEAFQNQLASQFAAADGLISQLNTTQDFLTTQLELLSSFYSNNK